MLKSFLSVVVLLGAMLPTTAQSVIVSGFDPGNPTRALKLAIQSSYDTLIINNTGSPWLMDPLRFEGVRDKVIILEEGVHMQAKKGAFADLGASLIKFIDCHNLEIIGKGDNVLAMHKEEYREGEFRHVLLFRGCSKVRLSNLTLRDSGGDGIILTHSKQIGYCSDIVLDRIISLGNKRQGISITSARNVLVTRSEFSDTEGTLPGAGVDLEPNAPEDILENIVFRECIFRNNFHAGIKVALDKLTSASSPISVVFEDCLVQDNFSPENPVKTPAEIFLVAHRTDPVQGSVTFKNCLVEHSDWPLLFARNNASGFEVYFQGGMARDLGRNTGYLLHLRNVNGSLSNAQSGVYFEAFHVEQSGPCQLFEFDGPAVNNAAQAQKITGTILVTSSDGIGCRGLQSGLEFLGRSAKLSVRCSD